MDVCAPLIAHLEPSKAIEPGQCPLDHPAIAPQPLTRLDATPSDARDDARAGATPAGSVSNHSPCPHAVSLGVGVVALVAFQAVAAVGLRRPSLEPFRVMDIGPRDGHCQRQAVAIHDDVALGAQLATIRRILASRFAPPGAGTLALSSDARVQSMRPRLAAAAGGCDAAASTRPLAASRADAASRSSRCHSPSPGVASPRGCRSSRRRRCQSRRRGLAMVRGRPPLGLGGSGGRRGATISHSSSLTNGVLMPPIYHTACGSVRRTKPARILCLSEHWTLPAPRMTCHPVDSFSRDRFVI